tara:strand:- start:269 stop:592 length:324 start_codon:yes stop_codon:yes gene_type:complete
VPTIYEMLNVNLPKSIDGISLVKTIKNGSYDRPYMYGVDKESQYIRVGMMKLIVWIDFTKELYNIANDPHEQKNLISQYPELVDSLYAIMVNHELEQTDRALSLLKN